MTVSKQDAEVAHLEAEARLFEEQARQLHAPLWKKSYFWTVIATLIAALIGLGATVRSDAANQLESYRLEQLIQQQKITQEVLLELNRTTPRLKEIFLKELLDPNTCNYLREKVKTGNCDELQRKYQGVYGYLVGRALKEREAEVAAITKKLNFESAVHLSEKLQKEAE